MREVKHTPGPWECEGDFFEVCRVEFEGSGSYTTISSRSRISGPVAFAVGTPDTHWRDDAEQEANARLIAAAPDLLEAMPDLTAVIAWLRNGCEVQHSITELEIYQRRIDAAIARARGEQSPNHSDQKEVGNG